ncbi:putative phosphorylated IMV membrane protein [Lumpy skin disease virus]|uniref:IMV membrane protein n=1 Tax=Lumpy skin disease virus TaxID=59509 RepID=Q91MQ4_LSDV|nr:LSDV109 putative phosphorylated IMV membrane protein [Lumpy skin disease virus NI-2490]AAN02677.1 putative phosphorylated IMV membrane protein [Lumpy skin disease virus NW-LW]AOE47685.1 putative phosphorylated IMV membrane protein [Lumpy skin disease virus]AAK85070.1 LSDV109 putative phosphorylated IMV membrane protein [Lumpy skin disease virus NI-2490]ARO77417.1 putative phosphorylated IMV membrane protein [Lumpy skin disease virus]ART89435.1 putative phosphorylated IMV membrane protein [L
MSYLSYYNMFSDFTAGAGVSDNELFTREEEEAFLPKEHHEEGEEYKISKHHSLKNRFPNILMRSDIRALIGLILFVLAITTTPIIAVIMIAVASALLPFPSLVIAYCLSIQKFSGGVGNNKQIIMSILCVSVSIITLIFRHISSTAYTISYIILAILFCVYAFNISKISYQDQDQACYKNFKGGNKYREKPSFYEE